MPATKNPFPKSIDVYISPTYNYSSIQVACHKAWLTTSCFQLKWFQFFHRKKPSTLAFNTSASSNSCGLKWGPSFDFSGHLEGMGMLFLTSHDWSGWQIDWKLENPATLISWNGKEIIFKEHSFFLKIWMYDAGVQKQGEDYPSQQLQWNQLHGNFAIQSSFTAVKTKPMKTFHSFSLQFIFWSLTCITKLQVPSSMNHIKKTSTHDHSTFWKNPSVYMAKNPGEMLPCACWRSSSASPFKRFNKYPSLSAEMVDLVPVTWSMKYWLVNDGISYKSPSIYPLVTG